MENKEYLYKGAIVNGFIALLFQLVVIPVAMYFTISTAIANPALMVIMIVASIVLGLCWFIMLFGYMTVEPNQARVMVFFGKYKGTFTKTGFFWVHPFMEKKQLSLRARNLDVAPIKVNDKMGNPIMIGLVLVWKLKDTYKAMFEIDSQTMVNANSAATTGSFIAGRMKAFEHFVAIQSDAALRQVAGHYAYDNNNNDEGESITLRDGGEIVNGTLEEQLNERLSMAGIEVVEARINYLAYAPEIAAVMLRRQQADAIIAAREKIVEGAVSMVKMALEKLDNEDVVELDDEKKAAMVSNLLVVLCADEPAQPVINSGTLNH